MTELSRAYGDLRVSARSIAADGRPVIGIVGRDVPSVLVAATGALPFRIPPEEQRTDDADAVLGRAVDRPASLLLAELLSGALDFLSGVFISHDCEASLRLFYTAQELHRRGRVSVPVHLVDQVHLVRETTLGFNTREISRMWTTATSWASNDIDLAALEAATAALADVRTELIRLRDARRTDTHTVSGVVAFQAYTVATASPVDLALSALRSETPGAADDRRVRVFLTGSAPIGDELYRAIEDAGGRVVGEDHDRGDPVLSDVLPVNFPADREGSCRALALSRLHGAPASASSSMAERAGNTSAGIRESGARALLSIVRDHDDAPAWDWKSQLSEARVPGIRLRGADASDPERIAEAVAELGRAS